MFDDGLWLVALAGLIWSGLRAWSIRAISSGRRLAAFVVTFVMTIAFLFAIREVMNAATGVYVLVFALSSAVGSVLAILVDRHR